MELTVPEAGPRYHRRVFLGAVVAGGVVYWLFDRQSRELERVASLPVMVTIAQFDAHGGLIGRVRQLRIHRSDDEWRRAGGRRVSDDQASRY